MAKTRWTKAKANANAINNGNEYTTDDNLTINELNAIVNNSLYATQVAEEANEKANSAFEANGTLVKVNGKIQSTWSADFVENERTLSGTNNTNPIIHKTDLDSQISSINGKIAQIYPIGSIYLTIAKTPLDSSSSPASWLGGTWELLPEGYALWTTTTAGHGGNIIGAGLPNIVGFVDLENHYSGNTSSDGALTVLNGENSPTAIGQTSHSRSSTMIKLDASLYNTIYGMSNTVQPPAYCVYAWKRIA